MTDIATVTKGAWLSKGSIGRKLFVGHEALVSMVCSLLPEESISQSFLTAMSFHASLGVLETYRVCREDDCSQSPSWWSKLYAAVCPCPCLAAVCQMWMEEVKTQ